MHTVTDPRVRAWLADPGQRVLATDREQVELAAMALQGVREVVSGARLVVFVRDEGSGQQWHAALAERGLATITSADEDTAHDGLVTTFAPAVLAKLARSPEELWVDDGVLDMADRDLAGGAWQLRFDTRAPRPRTGRVMVPRDVAVAQRWLATTLAPRPVALAPGPGTLRAAEALEVDPAHVSASEQLLSRTDGQLLMWTLEQLRVPGTAISDREGAEEPRRTVRSLGDDRIEVLVDAALVVEWRGDRAFVQCRPAAEERLDVAVFTAGSSPSALLGDLLDHVRGPGNPHRGRVVEVGVVPPPPRGSHILTSVHLTGVPRPRARRSELVLDDEVWRALDVNVRGVFARADRLAALGLGTDRGVLLEGPPGVGKTHATRVLVSELVGEVTVFLVPAGIGDQLAAVYEYARLLAPTLVVIEDIDLVAGTSRSSGSQMHALLDALDGLMSQSGQVVTLATTNRAAEMDASVRRAARFDRIVSFGPPPLAGRRRILARYLAPVGTDGLDLDHLAAISEGATGADLREVVRHAVLETEGTLTTGALADAVRARDLYRPPARAYL